MENQDDSIGACSSSFPSTSDDDASEHSSDEGCENDIQRNVLINSSNMTDRVVCNTNHYAAQSSYRCKYKFYVHTNFTCS